MRGMRSAWLWLLLLPCAVVGARAVAGEAQPSADLSPAVIVLDASKHMAEKIGSAPRIGLVRSALGDGITSYQDKLAFGLVAFGYRQASNCADTQTIAKPGELNSDTQAKLLGSLKPKGQSPIAAALSQAARLASPEGKLDIVLIAGSVDSCKADVCGTAELLKQKTPGLRIHVLAFGGNEKDNLESLRCVADKSGGQFAVANDDGTLQQGLKMILDVAAAPPANPAMAAADVKLTPSSAGASPGAPAAAGNAAVPGSAQGSSPSYATQPPPPQLGQTEIQKGGATAASGDASGAGASNQPVPITLKALLTESGPPVQSGLTWRVFAAKKSANGTRKLISTDRNATPTEALAPGEYLINAAYGLSNVTKKIKVEGGVPREEVFILNCGALKLSATLATGEALPIGAVHFDIMSDEEDQFGNRRKVLGDAKPGVTIRLNAGAYHVVSRYGDANATVQADVTVEPGKLTEATIKQAAAPVTLKLVQEAGGEALADTHWSVITPTGDVVKETTGALPTHILAAGKYAVVAQHGGLSYTSKFTVETGHPKEIEVVVEEGPTSPEALRAITNPSPPPAPGDDGTMVGSTPGSPDVGMGFDGGPAESHSGPFINPGILLRPTLR